MGSPYRSEQMQLCQLIAHKDAAFACIAQLGKRGCVQFKDVCAKIYYEVRHGFLESQVREAGIPMDAIDFEHVAVPNTRDIYNLEIQLSELERDILQQNEIYAQMRRTLSELMEFYYVLQKVDAFFEVHMEDDAMNEFSAAELEEAGDSALISLRAEAHIPWLVIYSYSILVRRVAHVRGEEGGQKELGYSVEKEKRITFERVLWRACRWTAFVRDAEIEDVIQDPLTGTPARKCVFVVFFKGQSLKNIVNKVCEGFNASLYACPKTAKERHTAAIQAIASASDLRTVIDNTQKQRISVCLRAFPLFLSPSTSIQFEGKLYG
ncbi:unnamed protein product [Toxocara canis]|uniref:V-type proton ATPase subunit a n=1 Tax=Toxocara canis TaxID=6265 RepID=A0A183U0Z0_TOXCA|nr:unnamed protein product [Toxocara canis]